MKKKELKNAAKKIAEAEYVIQNSKDQQSVEAAKQLIMHLTNQASSFEELEQLDELVQEYLKDMG